MVFIPTFKTFTFTLKQSNIIISTLAFLCILKLLDFNNFQIYFYSTSVQTSFTYKIKFASNIYMIPPKYYKFANIFSKFKAKVLASYYPYNLKINLEEGV